MDDKELKLREKFIQIEVRLYEILSDLDTLLGEFDDIRDEREHRENMARLRRINPNLPEEMYR